MHSITVSIVSHGHGAMLGPLLNELAAYPEIERILLTRNVAEPTAVSCSSSKLHIIENAYPRGFGENHNAAFEKARSRLFCVLNPDIRLSRNPFPVLLKAFRDPNTALAGPAVVAPSGDVEDNAREFPSVAGLVRKALGSADGRVPYVLGGPPRAVPWVAGMFMLVRASDFEAVGGFDESFYLYYEDVDLCVRMWKLERRVLLCPAVHVVHDARRASRGDIKYARWHLRSIARYFRKYGCRNMPNVF